MKPSAPAIIMTLFFIASSGCENDEEVAILQAQVNELEQKTTKLSGELVEKQRQLEHAIKEKQRIEKEVKERTEALIQEITMRLTAIEATNADALSKEAELDEALKHIEKVEEEFAEKKRQAFNKIEELETFMTTYDPEWAFIDYDQTAVRLYEMAVESAAEVEVLEKEILRLKGQIRE